jgi:hypothetical protein
MSRAVKMAGFTIEGDVVNDVEVTSYAGLLPYIELWGKLGMRKLVDSTVHICGTQGWLDRQIVESLVLLNLAGGDCVTDIDKLESDPGLSRMFDRNQYSGMNREAIRAAKKRFRSGKTRAFPAATQLYTFLEQCHNTGEECKRVSGKAFVPEPNEHLLSLRQLNTHIVNQALEKRGIETVTLDCDATLIERLSKMALMCYKGFPGYQPYNIWIAELNMMLHSEFRDGNVPAGYSILRPFQEAVAMLPDTVKKIFVRQDTAAYQNDLMAWFERAEEHPRFGRIHFTISADITQEFRKAVAAVEPEEWHKEYKMRRGQLVWTGREYAEVVFVSNAQAVLTGVEEGFRFIAIREKCSDQLALLDVPSSKAPFPVMEMDNISYKLHAIVTNRRDEPADELIDWHFQRCGKSEEAHSVLKTDFAGGQMPSAQFGANAAWWALVVLAMNFNAFMKQFILGDKWENKRMKAIRFDLIVSPGRVVQHARQLFVRVRRSLQEWLLQIAHTIDQLSMQHVPT